MNNKDKSHDEFSNNIVETALSAHVLKVIKAMDSLSPIVDGPSPGDFGEHSPIPEEAMTIEQINTDTEVPVKNPTRRG